MLCNIYNRVVTNNLNRIGIHSEGPYFFLDLPPQVINSLKEDFEEDVFEIYLIQDDPYLKQLSKNWINRNVVIPEVKIVERIVETPPRVVEKTIEVIKEIPVEVPVEVIKEVPVEVIKEVFIEKEPEKVLVENEVPFDEDTVLIDTKIAFEAILESKKPKPKKKDKEEEPEEDLETEVSLEEAEEFPEPEKPGDPEEKEEKPKSKPKKKEKYVEVLHEDEIEVTTELTEEELKENEHVEIEYTEGE